MDSRLFMRPPKCTATHLLVYLKQAGRERERNKEKERKNREGGKRERERERMNE